MNFLAVVDSDKGNEHFDLFEEMYEENKEKFNIN